MSKPVKYFVIDPQGREHTRKSPRVYTHCVLIYTPAASQADEDAAVARYWRAHAAYWASQERASRGLFDVATQYQDLKDAWQRQGAAFLVEHPTNDDYRRHIEAKARENYRARTDFDTWGSVGWCGRKDLALKLAAQHPGSRIFEAQVK